VLFCALFVCLASGQIPSSHLIKNVPYHSQLTNWCCGDASLEMVLNYWGPDVDQLSIIDVARSASQEGTLTLDIIRTGKFSRLSSSIGTAFPNVTVTNGFPGRPRGLAAFWYDSTTPWADQAFAIVAQDIPLVLLLHLDPHGSKDGHFRVLIGYDYTKKTVTFLDPWDKDGHSRVLTWSFDDFLSAWNYTEQPPTPRTNPFFGAALYPWKLSYSIRPSSALQVILSATVQFPSFPPVTIPSSPASPVLISIKLMDDNLNLTPKNLSSVVIPKLSEGETVGVTWVIDCTGNCKGRAEIVAEGIVVGSVPIEPMNQNRNYAGYDFVDAIGGHVMVEFGDLSPVGVNSIVK